jgi:hypothetical protein
VNGETSIRFSLDNIEDGEYELFADYDKIPAGAAVRVLQRQTVVKDLFDTYERDTLRIKMQKLGVIRIDDFLKTFSLEFKTDEKRNEFFLNRFVLVRLPAYAGNDKTMNDR